MDSGTSEYSVQVYNKSHIQTIANFQVLMAKETQNLTLDPNLVTEAIQYLQKNPHFGFFLVTLDGKKVTGSLLLTFQNSQSWWIQSVYVDSNYRRKGQFTSLFQESLRLAKQRGAHSLKLYAENDNERAKNTYKKLGMSENGEKFYTYDFTFGKIKVAQIQEKNKTSSFKVEDCHSNFDASDFSEILQKQGNRNNKSIRIVQNEKCVGYATYFTEFSEWRFGLTYYVNRLFLQKDFPKSDIKQLSYSLSGFFISQSSINIGAFRFIFRRQNTSITDEKGIFQNGEIQHYDVMEIQF